MRPRSADGMPKRASPVPNQTRALAQLSRARKDATSGISGWLPGGRASAFAVTERHGSPAVKVRRQQDSAQVDVVARTGARPHGTPYAPLAPRPLDRRLAPATRLSGTQPDGTCTRRVGPASGTQHGPTVDASVARGGHVRVTATLTGSRAHAQGSYQGTNRVPFEASSVGGRSGHPPSWRRGHRLADACELAARARDHARAAAVAGDPRDDVAVDAEARRGGAGIAGHARRPAAAPRTAGRLSRRI